MFCLVFKHLRDQLGFNKYLLFESNTEFKLIYNKKNNIRVVKQIASLTIHWKNLILLFILILSKIFQIISHHYNLIDVSA